VPFGGDGRPVRGPHVICYAVSSTGATNALLVLLGQSSIDTKQSCTTRINFHLRISSEGLHQQVHATLFSSIICYGRKRIDSPRTSTTFKL